MPGFGGYDIYIYIFSRHFILSNIVNYSMNFLKKILVVLGIIDDISGI